MSKKSRPSKNSRTKTTNGRVKKDDLRITFTHNEAEGVMDLLANLVNAVCDRMNEATDLDAYNVRQECAHYLVQLTQLEQTFNRGLWPKPSRTALNS